MRALPAVAITRPIDLPDLLPRGLIQGHHDIRIRVQQLQVEPVAVEHRRRVHSELNIESAVSVLQIEFPNLVAIEIEAAKVTRTDEHPDVLAIRAGRSRGAVTLVNPGFRSSCADGLAPEFFALRIHANK